MGYASFLDILTNILFFALVWGVIASFILLCIAIFNIIRTRSLEKELNETITAEPFANSTDTSTKRKIEELLLHIEEEKRVISLELNNMSPTHKEVAEARLQKIEHKTERLINMLEYLPNLQQNSKKS